MISLEIRHGSDLSKRILKAVRQRVKASRDAKSGYEGSWEASEERTTAYLPERETERKYRTDRSDGLPQYTTIQIPYTYAVLLTMHTYLTTVFLGRTPVWQYTARHGEPQTNVMSIEALMDYQYMVGQQSVPLMFWLLDALKLSTGIVGFFWDEEIATVSEVVEDDARVLGIPTGKKTKRKITRRVKGYQGNRVYNVRIQDFFHDPRVSLHSFQKGEYCGVYNELSWNRLIEGAKMGKFVNLDIVRRKALNQDRNRDSSSAVVELPDAMDFGTDHVDGKLAADVITVFEFYVELIPFDWGLGKGDMPEKWVFTVTSDFEVVLRATPLGSLHNKFPFACQQAEIDPYSLFPRTTPEVVEGLQNTIDWLFNSHMYNVRKALNNQVVADPSRINMRDLTNPLPGGVIRLLPSAYGTPVGDAYEQFQIQDITRSHITDMQEVIRLGERTHGANDAIMGLTNPSSRRSATEIRSTNTFSVNRLKTIAEYMSMMGWSPLSSMMLQNTQQYYEGEMKLRLVGDLAQVSGPQFAMVDEQSIAGNYDYVAVDGTLPVDRFAQANLWRELMREMAQMPELMMQYDIGRIFAWVAQLTGLKNINQFRLEVVPDGQGAAAAQQGNVVPLSGQRGPTVSSDDQMPGPKRMNTNTPGGGPVG